MEPLWSIPNSAVKHYSGENTWREVSWENSSMPRFCQFLFKLWNDVYILLNDLLVWFKSFGREKQRSIQPKLRLLSLCLFFIVFNFCLDFFTSFTRRLTFQIFPSGKSYNLMWRVVVWFWIWFRESTKNPSTDLYMTKVKN